jgi:hypothetical protein
MSSPREVRGSPKYQGADEKIPYRFNFSAAGTPSNPVIELIDESLETDVTTDKLEGDYEIDGSWVTTPQVIEVVPTHVYRLKCRASVDGKTVSYFLRIIGEA